MVNVITVIMIAAIVAKFMVANCMLVGKDVTANLIEIE